MDTHIYIDESGTLPDPNDPFVVYSAVCIKNPVEVAHILRSISSTRKSTELQKEIKFYNLGPISRNRYLCAIAKMDLEISLLVIHKHNKSIEDTPLHTAMISSILLSSFDGFNSQHNMKYIFDRHFSSKRDIDRFNHHLSVFMAKELDTSHYDSKHHIILSIPDMIAGATLATIRGTSSYNFIFKNNIVSEKHLNWSELKRRFFKKNA